MDTGWSVGEWGEIGDNTVELTGVSATASVNADGLLSFQSNGWGRNLGMLGLLEKVLILL